MDIHLSLQTLFFYQVGEFLVVVVDEVESFEASDWLVTVVERDVESIRDSCERDVQLTEPSTDVEDVEPISVT